METSNLQAREGSEKEGSDIGRMHCALTVHERESLNAWLEGGAK